jgi:hypothetical protein
MHRIVQQFLAPRLGTPVRGDRAALAAEGPTWAAHWAALEEIDAAFRRTATAPPGT